MNPAVVTPFFGRYGRAGATISGCSALLGRYGRAGATISGWRPFGALKVVGELPRDRFLGRNALFGRYGRAGATIPGCSALLERYSLWARSDPTVSLAVTPFLGVTREQVRQSRAVAPFWGVTGCGRAATRQIP
jgi:hypothetical protein